MNQFRIPYLILLSGNSRLIKLRSQDLNDQDRFELELQGETNTEDYPQVFCFLKQQSIQSRKTVINKHYLRGTKP